MDKHQKTLSIPRFTAEASLYNTDRPYRMTASDTSSTVNVQLMLHGTLLREALDLPLYIYTINSPRLCEINYKKCMEDCSKYTPRIVPKGFEGVYDERLGVVGGKYTGYCHIQCNHLYNCGTDRVCLGGFCCRKEKVCGNTCCGDEEVCIQPGKCCPKNWFCGGICCEYPGRCTGDGCCPPDRIVCNNRCCLPGEKCSVEGCCPSGQAVCNNHCCKPGEICSKDTYTCISSCGNEGQPPCANMSCHGNLHPHWEFQRQEHLCTIHCGHAHQPACRTRYQAPEGGMRLRYYCYNHSILSSSGPANPENCICVHNTYDNDETDVSDDSGLCISSKPRGGDIPDPPDNGD